MGKNSIVCHPLAETEPMVPFHIVGCRTKIDPGGLSTIVGSVKLLVEVSFSAWGGFVAL